MTRRELPEFIRVPWGIKDAVLVVLLWLVLQVVLAVALGVAGNYFPAVQQFLVESNNLAATFSIYVLQVALGLGLVALFARKYKAGWSTLGWRKVSIARTLGYIAAILIIFIILAQLALTLVKYLVPGFNPDEAQNNDFTQNAASNRSLALIALVLLPPIFEETIFRGFIFPAFAKRTGVIWAAIISSVLFGFAHGQANIFVYTLVLGLLLCYLYVKTKSIIPGIIVHMLNNLLAFYALAQK